ncbi:glycoside hydrolase family 5 protein [Phlyctema vagabunda]|uniref:Glycoside hydrolase family 5 protein n=1 Tax=Phlyctema vagabunda TaxID=108571 RepID=A0ABR4P1D5_9HELO
MRSLLTLSLVAFGAQQINAQVAGYGQCGGNGYTGVKTCVSGYTCVAQNEWYSQCIPGAATTATTLTTRTSSSSSTRVTSTTSSTSTRVTSTTSSKVSTSVTSTVAQSCTAAFTPVSASAAFAGLNPGWNLGNTLDAIPDEGSWNNPPVVAATFSQVQAKGFKSVRIPVTWTHHFDDASPTWNINKTWMDRVETVVDQALALGYYVVLNMHHDSWEWADISVAGTNITLIEEKFARSWAQIGKRFACKSSKLIFEPINEPPGSTQEHGTELNKLNDIFLTEINKAGGYNPQRVVSLVGLRMDAALTSQFFKRSTLYPSQPWGIQFHYYSPYDFIFSAWGKTIWGSDADKASLVNDFALFHGNFSGIPTFIGEWDASSASTEPAARWKYFDFIVRTMNSFGYSSQLWDNGNDHLDRSTGVWRDPVAIDILINAAKGVTNTLADSTTLQSASSQNTSAYIFHKVGDPVVAQTATYLLNGNTLTGIKTSTGATVPSTAYTFSSSGVLTLTSAYLGTLYTSTAAAGIKETLTLTFSAGAALRLQIVQYDTPTIVSGTYTYKIDTSADLHIPLNYKGVPAVAAVKAVKADGTYVADDFTVYFGPLQEARWTYGSWTYENGEFIVYASGLQVLKATGQTVTLTVEFYPRIQNQNSFNITFTQ